MLCYLRWFHRSWVKSRPIFTFWMPVSPEKSLSTSTSSAKSSTHYARHATTKPLWSSSLTKWKTWNRVSSTFRIKTWSRPRTGSLTMCCFYGFPLLFLCLLTWLQLILRINRTCWPPWWILPRSLFTVRLSPGMRLLCFLPNTSNAPTSNRKKY